ncbi:hypothetical protein [Saccharopolyspora cebuensis]|uniref:Uncharacterized protein n=1 Tax=Saccharopolyspora cebuensis TaxID=418759 RepID=A0ABV4CMH2_9PSEU
MDVYDKVAYTRRLTGEVRDAQPTRTVEAACFGCYEEFERWCFADKRRYDEARAPTRRLPGAATALLGDLSDA